MLVVDNIRAGYDKSEVLFGMSFSIGEGEVVSLIGRNGMGKSTTIKAIMGLLFVRSGEIRFKDKVISNQRSHKIAQAGIGLVPEGRRVFSSLTVEENLLATARANGASSPWDLSRVAKLFPRLQERLKQSSDTLSGGEQQMLAIGRALMTNPQLLILDEATEGLAPLIRQEIWDCLHALKNEGMTILVVDKNLSEMSFILDSHYIVEKGQVVWTGSVAELESQDELRERYLGV